MATLDSKLSAADIQLLIDAIGDWEMNNNHDYHIMQAVKNAIVPDEHENEEQYAFVMQIKNHFKNREREINDKRALRQEQAIILKAKLMLLKNELGIDQLFDNANAKTTEPIVLPPMVNTKPKVMEKEPVKEPAKEKVIGNYPDFRLLKAEAFLSQEKYVKIWELYNQDLNGQPSSLDKIEAYIKDLGMDKVYQEFLDKEKNK